MLKPIKVIDIEMSRPLVTLEGLDSYRAVKGLVRLHGKPIGSVDVPVIQGRCRAAALGKAILEQHGEAMLGGLLQDYLAAPAASSVDALQALLAARPPASPEAAPLVTVAVCTRDRAADISLCLDALMRLDYPALDILVVDNAPSTNATERLLREHYTQVRYVSEPRPGLDWARNRAIIEARGEIIAYTDDDVIVDSGWVRALVDVFTENPDVMAVTGLVVPHELETEAQILFEQYNGFGRGFERRWFRVDRESGQSAGALYGGSGQFGTGANMAYRRSVFAQIGHFDPALDVGTVTNGGGDLEMFFRVLKEGHTLVYEPRALVRHRHRPEYAQLKKQIANNGIGLYSYFVRSAQAYPEERAAFLNLGLYWLWWWSVRRTVISFLRPSHMPRELILAELRGSFIGLGRYGKAKRAASEIEQSFGAQAAALPEPQRQRAVVKKAKTTAKKEREEEKLTAVRTVDVGQPVPALMDVTEYPSVCVFVVRNGKPLGSVRIENQRQPISAARLRAAIADKLGSKLIDQNDQPGEGFLWSRALTALAERHLPLEGRDKAAAESLPADVSVSINLATLDRPDDLRKALQCLVAQESPRHIEIVVVDNNPSSDLTPPVVAEFPGVVLVNETRKGLAYARNAGFTAGKGDIMIATDDDVTMPPDWVEKIVAPFACEDVMIVTGNVLPVELETMPQHLFEVYGGLGRGFTRREYGEKVFESNWRHAVRTWDMGATANAAFRARIFEHPEIGLMDEALGPGMPSGVGEDTYLFYKVLKAGFTLVYEPDAYVWHRHRRDMRALRRQIYSYSKGHVSYHLTTLLRDHDLRALAHLAIHMPRSYVHRLKAWLRGQSEYPLSLILLEIRGNLAGPWCLWRSRRRVQREGLSTPYVPVPQRPRTEREKTTGPEPLATMEEALPRVPVSR